MTDISTRSGYKVAAWLVAQAPQIPQACLTDMLALTQLCRLLNGTLSPVLEEGIGRQLAQSMVVDYTSVSLFTALLAACAVSEYGTAGQVGVAKEYLSAIVLLDEVNFCSKNKAILSVLQNRYNSPGSAEITTGLPLWNYDKQGPVNTLLDEIEIKSCFGCKPIIAAAAMESKLEGLTMSAFKSYDIPLALRCLRARNYVAEERSFAIQTALCFLQYQFDDNGNFGDFEPAFELIDQPHQSCMIYNIKLTMAQQVIWTLYELEGKQNRVLNDIAKTLQRYTTAKNKMIYA